MPPSEDPHTVRDKVVSVIAAAVLAALFFAGQHFLGDRFPLVLMSITALAFAILLTFTIVMVGFTVLKCLFFRGAGAAFPFRSTAKLFSF